MASQPGSDEHKALFCRTFVNSHEPYEPGAIVWPALDELARRRLASLPIWSEAVNTERETALKVHAMARAERDPVIAEAIAVQAYEEARHASLLVRLTAHYGIRVAARPEPPPPADPEWAFLGVGFAECFDSFFAFGLFALARDSGFLPPALIRIFDPIMQEEARHILFFENWKRYRRVRTPAWARPPQMFQNGLAASLQIVARVRLALELGGAPDDPASVDDNFLLSGAQAFGEIAPRTFVDTCLRENERRLAPYDPRLLRPRMAPTAARMVRRLLPAGSGADPARK